MRLDAGSRRLELHTEVDWHEHHRFLKVAFPVDIRSSRATYEIQHGHLERPTVWNTSWDVARFEVCAQRWADLSETGYGVALLNDSKYGYDVHGNVMRLSLLRAPGWPDPEADRGHHSFAYALLPHRGTFQDAGVAAEAEAFNVPLAIVRGGVDATRSFVSVDRGGVSIEAVKKADREDALVVRVCEIDGRRGPVRITVDATFTRAVRTDLLERGDDEVTIDGHDVVLSLRPFELVTLKLT
jgi:alpha-mannosidase